MIDIRQLPNLNIQQKDFVSEFYREFDFAAAGSGLLRNFANVEPLLFEGAILGSEFDDYAATKLYLCFDFNAGYSGIAAAGSALIRFYDENNVINLYSQQQDIAYDSVAPAIIQCYNNAITKNVWFSRITNVVYDYIKFIGYRITLD